MDVEVVQSGFSSRVSTRTAWSRIVELEPEGEAPVVSGLVDYAFVTSAADLNAIAAQVRSAPAVALDLETTSLNPRRGRIRIISLNTGSGVYVIDLFATGGLGPLREILNNPGAQVGDRPLIVGQNLKFDQKWLAFHDDVWLWPMFDTFRASALLHNGRRREHDLYALYARELGLYDVVDDMGASGWADELSRKHLAYAAEDVTYLLPLYRKLRKRLAKADLLRIALVEFRAIWPEVSMELAGFRLDPDKWLRLSTANIEKARVLRQELLRKLPHPTGQRGLFADEGSLFNVDSIPQLTASLARLGLRPEDTSKGALAMLAGEHPIVRDVLAYREVSKRVASFGKKYLSHVDPMTQRVHTNYFPFTGAGRYASSGPNLQQIPRAPEFRACFCPVPGRKLVLADYSQIELRLVAELAGDRTLMDLFVRGVDVHTYTASVVCGVPVEEVQKWQRQLAKPVNFGLIYGLMPAKLVVYAQANYGVSMTLEEARAFWRKYFDTYAGVKKWQERTLARGKEKRISRTPLGRRRFLDRDSEHNSFLNSPVQGAGADGLKQSLWSVWHRLRKFGERAQMVHMVHDEIVLEVDDEPTLLREVARELEAGMKEGMANILYRVPVEVAASVCGSWADKA